MEPLPPVRFAESDGVYIAFAQCGDGDEDVVLTTAATSTMDANWSLGFIQPIAEHARVTFYDKRGLGRSDGGANFTFEERMDDIRAVMDAADIESAHLAGMSEGGPLSLLFAATYPERVQSLSLYGTYPAAMRKADYPDGWDMTLREFSAFVDRVVASRLGDPDAVRWFWEMWSPTHASDPEFVETMAAGLTTSPSAVRQIWEALYEIDVRHVLPSIHVPTSIVHRVGDRAVPVGGGRYLAEHIVGATLIELDGDDHVTFDGMPEWADAIADLIATAQDVAHATPDRRLATVLFTDIVDSTPAAAAAGDRQWREVLDRHDSMAAELVARSQGRVVKGTGDGMLATFDGPSRALTCATQIHDAMSELGLAIRAGLHTGEIEVRGADVAGLAVHIAARVSGLARAHETLVSSTVKDLVVGAGFDFEDRGPKALKGIDGDWHIYAAANPAPS